MSKKIIGYVVTLQEEESEEYSKTTVNLLKQLKNVVSVEVLEGNIDFHLAYEKAYHDIKKNILDCVFKKGKR